MTCSAIGPAWIPRELVITTGLATIAGNSMFADAGRRAVDPAQRGAPGQAGASNADVERAPRRRERALTRRPRRPWRAAKSMLGKPGRSASTCAAGMVHAGDVAVDGNEDFTSVALGPPPVFARPPAALLDEPDVADDHRLVHRLHHVVDRQRRHRHGGERLHLDAGLRARAHARLDP